jgi:DNA-directed RNA polymerase subunit RPC12/RpoP
LKYLTFECFQRDTDDQKLRQFAQHGYFAFQDYAVAKWGHHLRATVDMGLDLLSDHPDNVVALYDIEAALYDFIDVYDNDGTFAEPPVPAAKEACKIFERRGFYENLLYLWSHITQHQQKGPEFRNEISLKDLGLALMRNREILETLPHSNGSSHAADLNVFYGDKAFKCPKVTCHYFHEGFKDANSRETHIRRHDRPYNCTVADCLGAESGFSSNKDLEKHMRAYHFELCDLAETFATKKAVPATTPYKCHLCDRAFTRKLHLDSHTRNHNGERPYACDECGKAFTRSNDMRRHKKIHSRR